MLQAPSPQRLKEIQLRISTAIVVLLVLQSILVGRLVPSSTMLVALVFPLVLGAWLHKRNPGYMGRLLVGLCLIGIEVGDSALHGVESWQGWAIPVAALVALASMALAFITSVMVMSHTNSALNPGTKTA